MYQAPDRRTQVEQVDDLLEQLCEEVEIDSLRIDPVKDIEARLAHLRQGEGEMIALLCKGKTTCLRKFGFRFPS